MRMDIIETLKNIDNLTLVPHINPDVDAILSCCMLQQLLDSFDVKNKITLLSEPDEITKEIIERNHLFFPENYQKIIKPSDNLFLLDVFNLTGFENQTVGCIDHHPTRQKLNYKIYINEHYSSTCKLLFYLFPEYFQKKEFIKNILFSIYIDTDCLKNSKFNIQDKIWINEMIKKYDFDEETLIKESLCLNNLNSPIDELCQNGSKSYLFPNGKKAKISYIAVSNYDNHLNNLFLEELAKEIIENDIDYFWMIIRDLTLETTRILKGETQEILFFERLLSRSVDVYPMLEALNLTK